MVPFIFVNDTLTVFVNKKLYTLTKSDACFNAVMEALNKTEQDVVDALCVNIDKYIGSSGRAKVVGETIYIDDEPIHPTLNKRVIELMSNNLPFEHFLTFVENVRKNPSYGAQQELYDFLEHRGLPITDDGCFLGYKAVQSNYLDKYSGTFDNHPGKTVSMDRPKVDDDRTRHCSKGLHVGSLEYVRSYASGDDKIIIVKVNPRDAVSVPTDCSFQKLRCCQYEVLDDFEDELTGTLYTNDGIQYPHKTYSSYEIKGDKLDAEYEDFDEDEVTSTYTCNNNDVSYGIKPDGRRYYNIRQCGRFVKQDN